MARRIGKYWKRICEMQERQQEKGLLECGEPLEENGSLLIGKRLEYLEEELIDALMYIEHAKEWLRAQEDDGK